MSEFHMFLTTLVVGVIWMFAVPPLLSVMDERILRWGLRLSGICGHQADEIVEFHKTGRLPR